MTLGEAWATWFSGQMDVSRELWGVQLFWWGRLGKALQVLAGLTIVAEIIGAPALRKFGNSLHRRVNMEFIRENAAHLLKWLRLAMKYYFTNQKKDEQKKLEDELNSYTAQNISIILALGVGVYYGFFVHISDFWLWQALSAFGMFILAGVIVAPLFVFLTAFVVFGVGMALDILLIEPVAWLLERESLDRIIKLFAFVALVVGFHFDFLAS